MDTNDHVVTNLQNMFVTCSDVGFPSFKMDKVEDRNICLHVRMHMEEE